MKDACNTLQVSDVKKIFVLALVITIYVSLSFFRFGGLMAYIIPSICWSLLALITLYVCGLEKIRLWYNKKIFAMAGLIAIFQIFILVDAGIFTGFGKSPYSFTPTGITINLILVSSTLLGTELSRAYLIKNFGRKKPILTMGLVTLLYSFVITPIAAFLTLDDPLTSTKFLGSRFLPTITENLLASYLALLAGPIASLAYRAPLKAFQWFSPILPDLPWGYEALLGVLVPTIGFVVINQSTTATLLRKIGIQPKTRKPRRFTRSEKSSIKGWIIVSVLCVLMVWTSTGLLGFYPTTIASGSMRPTLDVGDIAITIQTRPETIKVGDIIQYWREGEAAPTIHRVVEIYESGGTTHIITKGDANTAPDDPITTTQTIGKVIYTIPKLGWISIYTKTAIATIWSFFSTNVTLAYATLATTLGAGIYYTIHRHKNRPRYWTRRRGW